ncbi:MAG: ABC transporter ATP-binding protein [Firmicutes bacterium]|nr:ABC transporter ATP-binding protein [Bacillota bacterium]
MIQLYHVSKTYAGSDHRAVDGLDLTVRTGEIYGFLGPNGAGKTTTIKMIVGLLLPDQGRVEVDGFDVVQRPLEAKRRIGFVPDNPDLYERLSGREYLNFVADVYGIPSGERARRAEELLEVFELTGAVDDRIESYSHGMKQKIAVTAALLPRPPVLILDEPMVGLDPRASHLFKEIMREHCDAGGTVFFSTHILEVAERLCDRVGILHHGRLIAEGTMDELRRQHQAGDKTLEDLFLRLTEKE